MTLADRPVSATPHAQALPASAPTAPIHRPWWRRLIDALIPGRRAEIRRYEAMVELAGQNPPPQRWYDEDFSQLRKPPSA
jgi:hypothetical protein